MSNNREALGLAITGLWLVFGCGGRSDTSLLYSDVEIQSGGSAGTRDPSGGSTWTTLPTGGTVFVGGTTARGGSIAQGSSPAWGGTVARGGSPAWGGTVARGGSTALGGTFARGGVSAVGGTQTRGGTSGIGGNPSLGGRGGTTAKDPCCVTHGSPGCNDAVIESCVCKRDATCCAITWDSVCVAEVNLRGCGTCASGGAPSIGGTTGKGGSSAIGAASGMGGTLTGTGGTTATGGTVVATGGTATITHTMIDDLEDGNGDIISAEGREGYWFTFNDGTVNGQQSPAWGGRITTARAIDDRAGSKFAAWTLGSGFTSWGGGIGLYLRPPNRFYNANKYRGISFWARITPGRANVVRVNVSDDQTVSDGNYCTDCWDHFGVTIVMSDAWQRFGYLWGDLSQRDWGFPQADAINPSKLRSIEFGTQDGVDFEIYIDDIAFIP